jgi:neutral ceramidase
MELVVKPVGGVNACRPPIAFITCLVLLAAVARAGFTAGFATAEITPPVGWRRAGGYSEVISTGVNDPLFAKAMVVAQGEVVFAFVGNDLCSVPRELTQRARESAAKKTGIPVANIVITATHTHGAPEYYGPLRETLHARARQENGGTDPREPLDYHALLVERWTEVIARAHAARQPVKLSVVVPHQLGVAFNRRYVLKDGSTVMNPGAANPKIFHAAGPVDPELPFVLMRDAATERPVGSLTVFAMHTAIYSGGPFGACYPGHLQTALRKHLDAPEFVSVFGEGAAGDVNHLDFSQRELPKGAAYSPVVGAKLAATIAAALPLARPIAEGQLAIRAATVAAPVRPEDEMRYAAAKNLMDTLGRNGAKMMTVVDAWRQMLMHEYWQKFGGKLPEEVQVVRFDRDTALVTLPHEIFVELGMAIKAASPFRTTIVVSLANDLDFYVPTRRAFEEGSYEVNTCPLQPGAGELLVQTAVRLLNELKP